MATARRRTSLEEGKHALASWTAESPRAVTATAVRYALEELTARAPGNSVEVRVPPFGVTQCIEGPRHTRGTPPNVVEMAAPVWIALARGERTWDEALAASEIAASGLRADLSAYLPLNS
ncbi:sterol carrier family protein [Haematomicrobium sanguinis]|uniref:sterol carrier family protein n=1 Tax=Haematomicrobium sanguinis TaxID=479106 RepID=UPI0004788ECD|nr:sterol carrier family protein [Haematomicrobium sanguinis]